MIMENQQQLYASEPYPVGGTQEYSLLIQKLEREADKTVIGVFWDGRFEGQETPEDLRFLHFLETWGADPDTVIVPLDANQVRSYSVIAEAPFDILVFPYGPVYPMDAVHTYSGESFRHFVKKGGSILTTGGVPFLKQALNGDMNHRNSNWETPLMIAVSAKRKNTTVINALLEAGADPTLKNNDGKTLYDLFQIVNPEDLFPLIHPKNRACLEEFRMKNKQ